MAGVSRLCRRRSRRARRDRRRRRAAVGNGPTRRRTAPNGRGQPIGHAGVSSAGRAP